MPGPLVPLLLLALPELAGLVGWALKGSASDKTSAQAQAGQAFANLSLLHNLYELFDPSIRVEPTSVGWQALQEGLPLVAAFTPGGLAKGAGNVALRSGIGLTRAAKAGTTVGKTLGRAAPALRTAGTALRTAGRGYPIASKIAQHGPMWSHYGATLRHVGAASPSMPQAGVGGGGTTGGGGGGGGGGDGGDGKEDESLKYLDIPMKHFAQSGDTLNALAAIYPLLYDELINQQRELEEQRLRTAAEIMSGIPGLTQQLIQAGLSESY